MSNSLKDFMDRDLSFRRLADEMRRSDVLGDAYKQLRLGTATQEFLRQDEERRKLLAGIGGSDTISRALADIERQRKLMEGPVEEARRLGLFDPDSDIRKSITATMEAQKLFESLFRRPQFDEIHGLASKVLATNGLAREVMGGQGALQTAMGRLEAPWLSIAEAQRSAAAFADIVAMGRGIDGIGPFVPSFGDALRSRLGDWRDEVSLPVDLVVDPLLRRGLYHEHGFDPALTDFTVPAFEEATRIAGLEDETAPTEDEADDEGFARANEAFNQLRRFEIAVRRFIDKVMRAEFGDNWIKRQVPGPMRDRWKAKRDAAVDAGEDEQPLINYADFTDYKAIIERGDNWNQVFKSFFRRTEDVRESFQRLFPVRIATMHARIITLDDELLLRVETKRILKAIRRTP